MKGLLCGLLAATLVGTDAAFIRRAKLKQKARNQYEPVVVVGQDRLNDSDDVDTVEVSMFGEPGAPEPTPTRCDLFIIANNCLLLCSCSIAIGGCGVRWGYCMDLGDSMSGSC